MTRQELAERIVKQLDDETRQQLAEHGLRIAVIPETSITTLLYPDRVECIILKTA